MEWTDILNIVFASGLLTVLTALIIMLIRYLLVKREKAKMDAACLGDLIVEYSANGQDIEGIYLKIKDYSSSYEQVIDPEDPDPEYVTLKVTKLKQI